MKIPYWLIIVVSVGYMVANYSEIKAGFNVIWSDLQ